MNELARRIDAALPQTQCQRCSYADCAAYAQAIASGEAGIRQCPPGGTVGIARLAAMYTMGANEFHVNVGHTGRGGSFAEKASQYTLGFNHNLTKRTKLYTYYTAINSPGKANDFNALAVGMRHNF